MRRPPRRYCRVDDCRPHIIDVNMAGGQVIVSRNLDLSRPPGQRQPRVGPWEPFRQPRRGEFQQPDPAQPRLFLSFPDGRSVSRFVSLHVTARAGKNLHPGMLDQPQPPLTRKPAEYECPGSRMLDHDTIPDISLTLPRGLLGVSPLTTVPQPRVPGDATRRSPRRASLRFRLAQARASRQARLSLLLPQQRHASPASAGRDVTESVAGKAGLPLPGQGQNRGQLAHSVGMPGSPAVTA